MTKFGAGLGSSCFLFYFCDEPIRGPPSVKYLSKLAHRNDNDATHVTLQTGKAVWWFLLVHTYNYIIRI